MMIVLFPLGGICDRSLDNTLMLLCFLGIKGKLLRKAYICAKLRRVYEEKTCDFNVDGSGCFILDPAPVDKQFFPMMCKLFVHIVPVGAGFSDQWLFIEWLDCG